MPAFQPRFEDLPTEIAVFPLPGALLLPQGRLPLNIFEPRYLAMTQDSLARGRMFGMIQPDPAAAPAATGPGLYRTGCLGRLSSFAETEDGRLLITLTGVIRYEVTSELPLHPGGYRRVRADYGAFAADLAPIAGRGGGQGIGQGIDQGMDQGIDRPALLASLRPYFRARRIEANWEAVEQTPDAMLATTLAMICPFTVAEKQALLEAPTLADRAATLTALLRMGAHGEPSGGGRAS
ncbi:LON peptidase substrate-binding domain-containing protein [Roseomonas sp. NAR14]|uniref:LON peptidase substrate-binding domain-containing protein n=1 Tax=Roseomonas acroporae TaxID=2937791 RepID=A0A9X2BY92_9PROT|nr:LON peptidase substrate-binding domain-containing protein [Roseomonas acroporae]MCK8785760.1 LON peptidase substrate-binding domain-containing protein [Roseomonas acroporae]